MLLYFAGCLALLPYLALAGFFLLVRRVAAAESLPSLIERVLAFALAVLDGEGLFAVALWGLLIVLGFVPSAHRLACAVLGVVSLASLAVVVTLHSGPLEAGQIVFLAPCLVIAAGAARGAFGSRGPIGTSRTAR
jgi:hypothetical protein